MGANIDPELSALIKLARTRTQKQSFIDPATLSGGMPPGPAAMSPMPPMPAGPAPVSPMPAMDPLGAMDAGGARAAEAGLPLPEAGGGGGLTEERVAEMIREAIGGRDSSGSTAPKKKVDINTEIYQIKKLLVMLLENLNIEVPPSMLLGDPAEDPHASPEQAAADPASAGAEPAKSVIPPIEPMPAAFPGSAPGGEKQSAAAAEPALSAYVSAARRIDAARDASRTDPSP